MQNKHVKNLPKIIFNLLTKSETTRLCSVKQYEQRNIIRESASTLMILHFIWCQICNAQEILKDLG